ncbi:MAG: class I SAM-dependent methyltransferase [Verrucomicrobiota bacterium]|nr:class I SAM-dependent methyltransferase [Verrucomicrobiota bacterium]
MVFAHAAAVSAGHEHIEACARVASLFSQRWLRHYVASKLRSDPVFPAAYEQLRSSTESLLDIGCGVGLLPFYLRERGFMQPILGLDRDSRKIAHAQVAAVAYDGIQFTAQDACEELPPFAGNIALLDVLHYLAPAEQQKLLSTSARRVPAGGVCLLRDAPREQTARFWATYAGERFAQAISWNLGVPLHFPARETLAAAFRPDEFTREEQPAWGKTPFNNRLFLYRRRSPATAPPLAQRSDNQPRPAAAKSVPGSGG